MELKQHIKTLEQSEKEMELAEDIKDVTYMLTRIAGDCLDFGALVQTHNWKHFGDLGITLVRVGVDLNHPRYLVKMVP